MIVKIEGFEILFRYSINTCPEENQLKINPAIELGIFL
jgi:hypothetical protein